MYVETEFLLSINQFVTTFTWKKFALDQIS